MSDPGAETPAAAPAAMRYELTTEFEFSQKTLHDAEHWDDGREHRLPPNAVPANAPLASATAWVGGPKESGHPHRRALQYEPAALDLYDVGGFCASWAILWLGESWIGNPEVRHRNLMASQSRLYELASIYAQAKGVLTRRAEMLEIVGLVNEQIPSRIADGAIWDVLLNDSVPQVSRGGAIITLVTNAATPADVSAKRYHDVGFGWDHLKLEDFPQDWPPDWSPPDQPRERPLDQRPKLPRFRIFNPNFGEFVATPVATGGIEFPFGDYDAVLSLLLSASTSWGSANFDHAWIETSYRIPQRY